MNHRRYWHDLLLAYHCLARNDFSDADIAVVYGQGGYYRISKTVSRMTQHATTANVQQAIQDALKIATNSDDLLVIVTANHGDTGSTLYPGHLLHLWRGQFLTYKQLEAELKPAACCVLGVFGHCFGADMMGAVTASGAVGTRAAVAASKGASYAMEPDWSYDEFLYHFFAALQKQSLAGYIVDADVKGDKVVDIKEAYDFARKADRTRDQPAFEDNNLGNFIDKLTLSEVLP
jgi:hypothetical protein